MKSNLMPKGKFGTCFLKGVISRDLIMDLYWKKEMSQKEIAFRLNVTDGAIRYWMRKWNVEIRTLAHPIVKRQSAFAHSGPKNRKWNGGKTRTPNGYVYIRDQAHVTNRRTRRGYIMEHIIVWEKHHKKDLPKNLDIHHLNGIKDDNRIENLHAMPSREHKHVIATYKKRILELENIVRELQEKKNECDC